jgi:3-hydroxypropionate dehydrogenase (NADP+)
MSVLKNVAIVGAGTIGSSWGVFFASKGCKVNAYESLPEIREKILDRVDGGLRFLAENGLMAENEVESSFKRVRIVNSVSEALEDVEYVQESTTEDYDVKKSIFREMDAVANSDVILASSSSGLLMSEIQKATQRPERCIIAHPFNPPHIVRLVEIVRGEKTSQETVEATRRFMGGLGKTPVILNKEVPGHIANRLAAALWREAIDLVENDVASVEDVDKALCAGPGIRWALMGSHLTYHLGGGEGGLEGFIDTIAKKGFTPIWEDMKTWTSISGSAKSKLAEGIKREIEGKSLAELAQWRDDKLVKLLKVIYE